MRDELTLVPPNSAIRRWTLRAESTWNVAASMLPRVFPLMVAAVALGLWLVLSGMSELSSSQRLATWLVVVVPLALWLLVVRVLARSGAYKRPLLIPISVLLPPIVGLGLLSRIPDLPQILVATPRSWLIGFMIVRLVGAIFLMTWASGEVARPWFNLTAGSLDVLIGASALPVAWWVSSGSSLAVPVAIGWNVTGLLDFALAIVLARFGARTGGPGVMLSLNTPIVTALKPTILGIVTFGVPLAIIVHLLSLWQLI